jgi:hypothetical protein
VTKRDLHLVDEPEPNPDGLRGEAEQLRALFGGGTLDPVDHEALLALALGDDVVDEPALEAERLEAERLRAALDSDDPRHPLAALAASLRFAARSDVALADEDHAALLALTVCEVEHVAGALRTAEAEALRRAIEAGEEHPLAELATELRVAVSPRSLDELTSERLLRRALHALDERRVANAPGSSTSESSQARRRRLWSIASGLAALAAGVALLVAGPLSQSPERVSGVDAPRLTESQGPRAESTLHVTADAPAPRTAARESGSRSATDEASRGASRARAADPSGVAFGRAEGFGRSSEANAQGAPAAAAATEVEADGVAAPVEAAPPRRYVALEVPPTDSAGRRMARSTSTLFDPAMPFPARGGETDRLARIVAARAADLRANRFAAWGIR